MARGYIYEISNNLNLYPIEMMRPDELTNLYGDVEFDYAKNSSIEESGILDTLKQFGIPVSEEDGILSFTVSKSAKKNYFRERFQKAKELWETMDLSKFSESVYDLQEQIENPYADAVYFNGSFYTFDKFIRECEPGVTYYLGTVCLIH